MHTSNLAEKCQKPAGFVSLSKKRRSRTRSFALTVLIFVAVGLATPADAPASQAAADSSRFQVRALFYQAKQARDDQQWLSAAHLYRTLADQQQNNPYRDDATFWYAFCLQKADSLQEAALAYERYLEEFPNGKYAAAAEARLRNLLGRLGEEERAKVESLIRQMQSRKEKETRRRLIEALSRNSSVQDLPLLLTLLQKERDPSLRVFLIQTLGRSGDPEVVPYLVEVAKQDSSWNVRRTAITALGRISSDNAYLELLQLLNAAQNPDEVAVLVSSLAGSGKEKALPVLARVVRSRRDPRVQQSALREIASLATEASWDTLVEMALDPSLPVETRARAVGLLSPTLTSKLLDAATFRRLLNAARSTGSMHFLRAVLFTATRVDQTTWDEISTDLFDLISPKEPQRISSFVLRVFAHRGLGEVPAEQFLELCRRLDESNMQLDVLQTLKRRDVDLARTALLRLLQRGQPLPDLDKLVSVLPPGEAVDILEKALSSSDPALRQEAIKALAFVAFRQPRATELLIHTAESDSDYEVRQTAFQALSRMASPEAQQAVRRLASEFYR